MSFINSATAYANITDLLGPDSVSSFQSQISSALSTSLTTLVPSQYNEVKLGYQTIYNTTLSLLNTPIGQIELLLSLTGTAVGGDQSVAIQAALQHPFSQGRLWITTNSTYMPNEQTRLLTTANRRGMALIHSIRCIEMD